MVSLRQGEIRASVIFWVLWSKQTTCKLKNGPDFQKAFQGATILIWYKATSEWILRIL